jgi:hypothetical protein
MSRDALRTVCVFAAGFCSACLLVSLTHGCSVMREPRTATAIAVRRRPAAFEIVTPDGDRTGVWIKDR